jgi:Effector-associated domain 1
MKLNGTQTEDLCHAITSAFDLSELQQLTKFKLDTDLGSVVATDGKLPDVAFRLIHWAEKQGLTEDLIRAVRDLRPSNAEVQKISKELLAATIVKSSRAEGSENRPGPAPIRRNTLRIVLSVACTLVLVSAALYMAGVWPAKTELHPARVTDEELFKGVLMRVTPKPTPGALTLEIGLWLAGELDRDDINQLGHLAQLVHDSKAKHEAVIVGAIACPDQTVGRKIRGLNLTCRIYSTAFQMLDDKKVDAVLIVAGLDSTLSLREMKTFSRSEAIERAIMLCCQSGKDPCVLRARSDARWVLTDPKKIRPNEEDWTALTAAKKFHRAVWVVGGEGPNFGEWTNAVFSKKFEGSGYLPRFKPGEEVPREPR